MKRVKKLSSPRINQSGKKKSVKAALAMTMAG
jgi:hypothetical protein